MRSRISRHRKLSEEGLALLQAEADKIIAYELEKKPYKQLADESGLTLGSVQQLMARLLHERRARIVVVHRGTQVVDVRSRLEACTLGG